MRVLTEDQQGETTFISFEKLKGLLEQYIDLEENESILGIRIKEDGILVYIETH